MVNITIDGKTLSVPEGTTVLQAARSADIHIPTLCDHTELKPYGGCRLCLVEVEGARTLQPSCTLPVSNNMVVKTATDRVKAARKFVLTLIFSERNHFCPFCQVSGGDCELQNAAYAEEMTHWQLQPNWQPYPVDASHPYFVLDNNRCILCRRCVRACGELVGNFTLGFEGRGARNLLVADLGVPLGESTCISCGVCVQVCPTGALQFGEYEAMKKLAAKLAKEKKLKLYGYEENGGTHLFVLAKEDPTKFGYPKVAKKALKGKVSLDGGIGVPAMAALAVAGFKKYSERRTRIEAEAKKAKK